MTKVIVLNNDFTVLGTTSYKRAIRLIVKGKAETVAESGIRIHKSMLIPSVIRLIKAIRNLWKKSVEWSKHGVAIRDGYICQYCGVAIPKAKVTIDHVIPKAYGGKNSWENTVCSCFKCNNMKENRTPSEANMALRKKPVQPTIMEFLLQKIESEGLEEILKSLGIY